MNFQKMLVSKSFWLGLSAACAMVGAIVAGEYSLADSLPEFLKILGAMLGGGALASGAIAAHKD